MRLRWMLLSFRGRLSRSQYWLGRLTLSVLVVALLVLIVLMADWIEGKRGFFGYLLALAIVADLMVAWSGVALDVKRLHDHGLSAWWVLFALVPIVGLILPPVLFYVARGTRGPNRYGSDPVPPKPALETSGSLPQPKRRLLEAIF